MGLKAERPTDVVYLWTNEDRAELDRLSRAIEQAAQETQAPRRVAGSASIQDAADAYDAFLVEAKQRATQVHVRALQKKAWRELLAAHPPRDDVREPDTLDDEGAIVEEGKVLESFPMDQVRGFNVETMSDALVPLSVELWQFEGATEEERAAEREDFLDDLSDPAFSQIYGAAVRLNTDMGPDPKWSASSWAARMSAEMSRSDSPSD